VQAVVDDAWRRDAAEIYRGYSIYHQSGGVEQAVFQQATGQSRTRSETILETLSRQVPLPAAGRWLDVGCGNGATLRACSRFLPQWKLCGTEVHDVDEAPLRELPGFEQIVVGPNPDVPGTFDVISFIHVVEHIAGPAPFLRKFADKLKPDGLLVVQVPDCAQNPFMLLVADHASHYSTGTMARVVADAGYRILAATGSWVTKEITIVACRGDSARPDPARVDELTNSAAVLDGWRVLRQIVEQLADLAQRKSFGLFGTAIAATWLDAQSGGVAQFFVDEDPHRTGKPLFGRPVHAVRDVPAGAAVYVALPPLIAQKVATRLQPLRPDVEFIVPAA